MSSEKNNSVSEKNEAAGTSLFRKIWQKLVNRETIMYLIFGVLTTVINYAADILCYYLLQNKVSILDHSIDSSIANIIAWIVAVIFAFFVNKIFVFESKSWDRKVVFFELWTFMAARLFSLGFETLFLFITVDKGGMNNWLAKIISNVVVVILNYIFSKLFIFRKKSDK